MRARGFKARASKARPSKGRPSKARPSKSARGGRLPDASDEGGAGPAVARGQCLLDLAEQVEGARHEDRELASREIERAIQRAGGVLLQLRGRLLRAEKVPDPLRVALLEGPGRRDHDV